MWSREMQPIHAGEPQPRVAGAVAMAVFQSSTFLSTAAERAISRMKIALHAPSLGGVETLISRPAALSHRGLTPEQRRSIGIEAGLIRVSVGIENAHDLIDDFAEALQ